MSDVGSLRPTLVLATNAGEDTGLLKVASEPLQHGGGGGTLPPMEKAYIDSRIEATEARTDLKLSQFATKSTVWGAAGSIIGALAVAIGIILAALAYGGDRLQMGIGLADSRQQQLKRDTDQDQAVADINKKLDVLIAGQKAAPKK